MTKLEVLTLLRDLLEGTYADVYDPADAFGELRELGATVGLAITAEQQAEKRRRQRRKRDLEKQAPN